MPYCAAAADADDLERERVRGSRAPGASPTARDDVQELAARGEQDAPATMLIYNILKKQIGRPGFRYEARRFDLSAALDQSALAGWGCPLR